MSSISNASLGAQIQIAVAKKQLEAVEQQGKDALALIESSSPPQAPAGPSANTAPNVGTKLNIVG